MSDTVTVKVLRPFQDGGGADAQMVHPGAMLTCLRARAAELAANHLVEPPADTDDAEPLAEGVPEPAAATAKPKGKAAR